MADPFYLVKDEVQDSLNRLNDMFERWQNLSANLNERALVRKELVSGCESVEWQVDELDKAIAVAERDPSRFRIEEGEIVQRRNWTSGMHDKILSIRGALQQEDSKRSANNARRELSRVQDKVRPEKINDFLDSESEHQALIMREQDQELEEISASVVRIGGYGLTIHDELATQAKIVDDLDNEMGTAMERLRFVQKRLAHVIKKSGAMGQILLIIFLVAFLLFLLFLVFFG